MSPEHDWYPHIQTPKPDHVKYRIAVSHMPVLPVPGMKFSRNVMTQIQPSVIFSAHDHRGLDYTTFRNSTKEKRPIGNITLFTQVSSFTFVLTYLRLYYILYPTTYKLGASVHYPKEIFFFTYLFDGFYSMQKVMMKSTSFSIFPMIIEIRKISMK